jgi:hypothetical protein
MNAEQLERNIAGKGPDVSAQYQCGGVLSHVEMAAVGTDRKMTPEEIRQQARVEAEIREVKQLRVELDGVLQRMKESERPYRGDARADAIKKVQEGIMWLGMELKELGAQNPYPNSYNPTNTLVDKTADGLKL